jgi:hypothetical protein
VVSETASGPAAGLVDDPDEVASFAADTAFTSLLAIPRFSLPASAHVWLRQLRPDEDSGHLVEALLHV